MALVVEEDPWREAVQRWSARSAEAVADYIAYHRPDAVGNARSSGSQAA